MRVLTKALDLSETALAVVCVISFVVMFLLGIATVVFRFIIESSLAFPDELIRYLFVWMIFLGSAVALRRNMHAAIGLLRRRPPERGSPTAARDRPDVSHRGGNLRPAEA